jgi:hypothetical protein
MPTPKSLRSAPSRTFENYILTLTVDPRTGLTNVPQEKFLQIPGPVGSSGNDDQISDALDIGFPFSFDGRTHTKFRVSTNGWVILVDPAAVSFNITDVMLNTYQNTGINSLFLANHVLFAVWFDDLINLYSNPKDVSSPSLSTAAIDNYEKGLSQPDNRLNPRQYGVQYCYDDRTPEGRRLVVRWNCNSLYNNPRSSLLRFEFVLYENGKIEYRYAASSGLISSYVTNEDATIGVFMPGSSNRFRDFSYELGYGSTQRSRYKFGGAIYDSSYSNTVDATTVPYGAGLKPNDYWPAQRNSGAVFLFQPPLNRRRVLPRQTLRERDSKLTLPTVSRTGDSRTGNGNLIFDDRKSIAYRSSGVVINYPTTLPRFYSPEIIGVSENQDLFSGEFVVTGGISKANVQDYLHDNQKSYIIPFSENKLFENDPGSDVDSFFTVGTSVKDVGEGFKQPLKSKTQVRLSFRVDHKTTMFGASSSVYYFNSRTSRWQYPTSSFAGGQFDIANPYGDASSDSLLEVDRGFNAFGFNLASGSSNRLTSPYSTDASIGSAWNRQNESHAIIKSYDKSLQVDQRYSATQDESFTIPIQQPFLLEKAVIELPLEAGPGWFNDKTKCFIPITDNAPNPPGEDSRVFDVGGPGVTVALYNQVSTGPNKTKRDLILSGTITHQFDNVAEISYSNSPDVSSVAWPTDNGATAWQIVPQGFKAYATPAAVVNGVFNGSKYFFTGSVAIKCQAQISNGTLVRDAFYITQAYTDTGGGSSPSDAVNALDLLFSSSVWSTSGRGTGYEDFGASPGFRVRSIASVNNFGRGCTGFEPSGRSILGKEYITTQGLSANFYDNPFYLYQGQNTLKNLKNIANGISDAVFYASSLISRQTSFASPYLLLPGDKMVLSVSKARPVFFSTNVTSPYTSGSIQHDIKLTTGSINITLYGSLVANRQEFHDTLNQPLASDAIHEVVIGETKTW